MKRTYFSVVIGLALATMLLATAVLYQLYRGDSPLWTVCYIGSCIALTMCVRLLLKELSKSKINGDKI